MLQRTTSLHYCRFDIKRRKCNYCLPETDKKLPEAEWSWDWWVSGDEECWSANGEPDRSTDFIICWQFTMHQIYTNFKHHYQQMTEFYQNHKYWTLSIYQFYTRWYSRHPGLCRKFHVYILSIALFSLTTIMKVW